MPSVGQRTTCPPNFRSMLRVQPEITDCLARAKRSAIKRTVARRRNKRPALHCAPPIPTARPGTREKSLALFVTNTVPRAKAWPAKSASIGTDGLGIGFQIGEKGTHGPGLPRCRLVKRLQPVKHSFQTRDTFSKDRNLRSFRRTVFQFHNHDSRQPAFDQEVFQSHSEKFVLRAPS